MRTPQRLFLVFSAAIFLVVTASVLVNNHGARQSLEQSLAERAEEYRSAYGIAASSMLVSVSQMAALIAADDQTTRFMVRAHDAVGRNDDRVEGRAVSDIRYQWLQAEQPRFNTLRRRHGMSELNLYLARDSGLASFLRVHRPEAFGEVIDDPGHPAYRAIVDGNTNAEVVLDVDGVSLRAAAPVWGIDAVTGDDVVVGVVEAGLELDALLNLLHQRLGLQAMALLEADAVDGVVDESVIQRSMQPLPDIGCYRVAMVGPLAEALGATLGHCVPPTAGVPTVRATHDRRFAATWVPLDVDAASPAPAGAVMIWFDAESALAAYEHNLALNVAYAVGGFVLLELVLFVLLRAGVGFFESELRRRTSEIRQLNRKLTHMATTDALTGLYNRRHFLQRMQVEMDRVRRSGGEIALVLIDLDHFKEVNDRYGHQAGDDVLRKTGRFLREQVRSIDTAGRYGGEELCVLLPDTDVTQAAVIADRLREEIAAMRFTTPDGHRFGITASFGVAQWDGAADRDTLFVQADNALYAAKDAGRNRVVVFGEAVRAYGR